MNCPPILGEVEQENDWLDPSVVFCIFPDSIFPREADPFQCAMRVDTTEFGRMLYTHQLEVVASSLRLISGQMV